MKGNNPQPFLAINFLIATELGTFPNNRRRGLGTQPYVGGLAMFAGNFAPQGFAKCDGQILSVTTNGLLFAILGTRFMALSAHNNFFWKTKLKTE